MLRGRKEVSFFFNFFFNFIQLLSITNLFQPSEVKLESFSLGTIETGPLKGHEYLRLTIPNHAEKTRKIDFRNPYNREDVGFHDVVSNPDDEFCTVKLYKHYVTNWLDPDLPPSAKFFRRRAPRKEIRNRRKNKLFFESGEPFGQNYFNQLMVTMAIDCKFTNPTRCTAHGRRKEGISKLANSGVEEKVILNSARHNHVSTSMMYRKPDAATIATKNECLMYNPVKSEDNNIDRKPSATNFSGPDFETFRKNKKNKKVSIPLTYFGTFLTFKNLYSNSNIYIFFYY